MRLAKGPTSPLAKYDTFVRARGGMSSAQKWEDRNHTAGGSKWEGHCNGWAASAILRKEPRRSVRDSLTGVSFTVSDLKGLMAEQDICVKYQIFGHRYRGIPGDNLRDITPVLFHQVLTYYVGRLRKALVIDHLQGVGLDNHIVSGYTMNMRTTGVNADEVTTTLKIHRYASGRAALAGRSVGSGAVAGEWRAATTPNPRRPRGSDSTSRRPG
jgi:hypothetical protein